MSHLADLLAHAEVFQDLTEAQRNQLAGLAPRRSLEKGRALCLEGDHWPYVVYISSGSLRSVINSPDGRSYVVSVWEKGEVFWGHTLFDGNPMPSTLEAAKATHYHLWEGGPGRQV